MVNQASRRGIMSKSQLIDSPKGPFVLFSMGLHGYEGERDLWNVPEKDINVYHILVRIKHEMDSLRKRTGKDFYLFGTQKKFEGPKKKFIEKYGEIPMPILFTVNCNDHAKMENAEEPCVTKLKRNSSRGWRKMIDVDNRKSSPIPQEIRLWGAYAGMPYHGFSIEGFEYYKPYEKRYLSGKNLFYFLQDSPVRTWSQFRMGTLYVDSTRDFKKVQDRRIIASAKMIYPYIYQIKK
jgi:hypothetical protein